MFARGGWKGPMAVAAAALIALGLAACGSGGDTTQSTAQAASGGESTSEAGADQGSRSGADSFKVQGGDNSIQNYGEEADESEIAAVEKVLNGFLDARAAGNWAKACSYLAKAT